MSDEKCRMLLAEISAPDEMWRPVCGHEDAYLVSDHGKIFSLVSKRQLKCYTCKRGYRMTKPKTAGLQKIIWVHRAVLEAFGRPRGLNEICRHLDGNPGNNHFSNLRWGDQKENSLDSRIHGTLPIGRKNGASKLTEEQVMLIVLDQDHPRDIAKKFGVHPVNIKSIKRGNSWGWLTGLQRKAS